MAADFSAGFEPADRLAQDRESVRKRFWIKLKQVAAKLPFAEDLLAAYYCAFDKHTPRHVQVALMGAIAYFILPFDFIPDMMPVLGFTDDAPCSPPRSGWSRPTSPKTIARPRVPRCSGASAKKPERKSARPWGRADRLRQAVARCAYLLLFAGEPGPARFQACSLPPGRPARPGTA